ncbi:MAG TPA: glycosyltransferase, partial [Methanobacterium sp.]|nr:glycosyltransferase [Methanobacterium sp.]
MAVIDIIVGVKNEEEHIERCLKSLMRQTITDINILVVDGLSEDKTPSIVRKLMEKDSRIKFLTNKHENISSGRNIGLEASNTNFVAYLDGHAYVDGDWLEKLFSTFKKCEKNYQLAGVGSTYDSPDDDTPFGKVVAYCVQTFFGGLGTSFTMEEKVHPVETVAFALYKRDILEKEGIIYDEKMSQCEDTDFNHQLRKKGYLLLKDPEARVYQYRRKNLRQFFWQMFKYGEGRYKLAAKYKETLRYYHLIPAFVIFYLLFAAVGLLLFIFNQINSYNLILILLPVFIYLIIDIVDTIIIIIRQRSLKHASALLIFPAIHIGYG